MSTIAACLGPPAAEPVRTVERMLGGFRRYCRDGSSRFAVGGCAIGVEVFATARSSQTAGAAVHVDGESCVVFDGRLHDLDQLCAMLGLDRCASAPAAIYCAYQRYGEDLSSKLRGEFAFALWDGRRRTMIAAKDPFGVRPLYYARVRGSLLIASDPEQMIASGRVSTAPDEDVVIDYLLWDPRFNSRSFFREIRSVPPGHVMVSTGEDVRIRPYRFLVDSSPVATRDGYWTEYRRRFDIAVARRLESSYAVVAELSGGMDSSSIVCTADRISQSGRNLCPSIVAAAGVYPDLACNEEPFIDAVARHVRLPVTKWDGTRGSVDEIVEAPISSPGTRFATFTGTDGQILIARAAGARVILSGIGGDQIGVPWGGVRDAVTERRWADAFRMVVDRPRSTAWTKARVVGALLRSLVPSQLRTLAAAFNRTEPDRDWLSEWAKQQPRRRPEPRVPLNGGSEIARRNWRALTSGTHSAVMAALQQHAIRQSVEYRFPFLDLDLVSFALSIPARHWPPPWPFERLHREILGDRLPPEIVSRRSKANLEPGFQLRVRRHLPAIRELLHVGPWHSEQFVDREGARRLLDQYLLQKPDLTVTYGLWTIVTLEAWMRAVSRLKYLPNAGVNLCEQQNTPSKAASPRALEKNTSRRW